MERLIVDVYPMGDDAARRLEYAVYRQEGYIPENSLGVVLENENYPEFVHFVARIAENTIGSLRLVTDPKPRRGLFKLASFNYFRLHGWAVDLLRSVESRHVAEVGTMVILPEYRGSVAYAQLFRHAFEFALLSRVRYAVATIDEDFFHRLVKRGVPFRAMGEKKMYMGSVTVPALIDVEELAQMVLGSRGADKAAAAAQPALAS